VENKVSLETAKLFGVRSTGTDSGLESHECAVDDSDSFHVGHALSKVHTLISEEVGNVAEHFRAMINDEYPEDSTIEVGPAKKSIADDQGRESLFHEAMSKVQSFLSSPFDDAETVRNNEDRRLDHQMEEITVKTRNLFNERGEKLASLAEKTASLKDSSAEFMRLTRELSKGQQSRGFFF
jgi:hypothetical protein